MILVQAAVTTFPLPEHAHHQVASFEDGLGINVQMTLVYSTLVDATPFL
jgi:hypothetical protein